MSKNILLLSQELSYTGSPHSLLRIAKVLKKNNFYVEVWSLRDGDFKNEFQKFDIKVSIVNPKTPEIEKKVKKFDFAIVNTILSESYIPILEDNINFIWYIREASNVSYFFKGVPKREDYLKITKNVYCVSEYAKSFLDKYNNNVKVLHNCVEDYYDNSINNVYDKINFILIGTLEYRKGFDILLDAFDKLDNEYQSKCIIHLAGRLLPSLQNYWEKILERAKKNENIIWHGEITNLEEKIKLYKNMNVFVIVSRDESCSLVALESTMMGKPLIVSTNVGAKYIVHQDNGWIIENENVEELKNVLIDIISNPQKLTEMGKRSREYYLEQASMEVYEKSIINMVNKYLKYGKILLFLKNGFQFQKTVRYIFIKIFWIRLTIKRKNK
ncbi:glycosyltransferase family 4 protein [Brachyspira pulli]|uniref:glycosyltransferase family 4 protein n=1 Tax=Brachyspira pulli TaxID=310721 RepID=UPI00300462D7